MPHSTIVIYIYALIDPRTGDIRYIGKTKNLRARNNSHRSEVNRKTYHLYRWIAQLKQQGLEPDLIVLEETNEQEWAERECFWIAKGRELGWRLTNITNGGKGGPSNLGREHSEQTRKKISLANSGSRHHQYGKKVPESTKRKIIESVTGERNHFYGRSHNEETKQMISEKKKGSVPVNRRAVIINGIIYKSVMEASIAHDVSDTTIIHRIRSTSGNFQEYTYLDEQHKDKPILTKSEMFSGEGNPSAKINWDKVNLIRELRHQGLTLAEIAGIIGLKISQVGNICSGKSWKETKTHE